MLNELTPEQRAKLARGWVWRPGHAALWTQENGVVLRARYIRPIMGGRRCEIMGERGHTWRPVPRELTPRLEDDVTADGMERTAKAMYGGAHDVYLYPNDDGSWDAYLDTMPGGWRIGAGATKQAALLAAILAAPEAQ